MSRPRAYVGRDTTKTFGVGIYGIFEREKHCINISAVYKSIFKIPTLRVLVYSILCRYSREEYKENKRIYCEPI